VISFSLSTLDEKLAATLEPGAPSPRVRLETMKKCKDAGFLVGINAIPSLPYISDSAGQLEEMVAKVKSYGADYILIGGLTLYGSGQADSKTLYYKFLERTFPGKIKDYQTLYRDFFMPSKTYLRQLDERAEGLCRKYDIPRKITGSLNVFLPGGV